MLSEARVLLSLHDNKESLRHNSADEKSGRRKYSATKRGGICFVRLILSGFSLAGCTPWPGPRRLGFREVAAVGVSAAGWNRHRGLMGVIPRRMKQTVKPEESAVGH